MPARRTLWLADHLLKDGRGHHANYNRALASAAVAAGWDAAILCHRATPPDILRGFRVNPVFRTDLRAEPPAWAARSMRLLGMLDRLAARRFSGDLARGAGSVPAEDVIFAQMLAPRHLRAWLDWHARQESPPHLVMHLGYDPSRFSEYPGLAGALKTRADRRHFVSDSAELARAYEAICRSPVAVLPHVVPEATPISCDRPAGIPPCIVSLGNPRREKGFPELVQAALQAKNLRFVLQVNDPGPGCAEAVGILRRAAASHIRLADGQLSEPEYFAILSEADVVAVPYHLDVYRDRTSGVLCEALAAGKPVITTRDSWMSREFQSCGWLVTEKDPADLSRTFARVPAEIGAASVRARAGADAFRSAHSGARFLALLQEMIGDA